MTIMYASASKRLIEKLVSIICNHTMIVFKGWTSFASGAAQLASTASTQVQI